MATSTIARPSLSDLVNASVTSGVDLATLIIALDKGFAEHDAATIAPVATPTVVKPTKVAQTKPTTKRTPAHKAADIQAAPNMRLTTDGRMMNAENGTATKNQIARNIAFAEKHGFIVEDFASFSMADASDWYADAKSAL